MIRKTIAILLALAILIGIPESFAHPQNGGSCGACHVTNPAQNGLSTADMNKNGGIIQGKSQPEDTRRQTMNPMRYNLGVIGTGLIVISQFYSLRKRGLRKKGR